MAEKHVVTFSSIAEFFKENNAQLARGENSYTSKNVLQVSFDPSFQPFLLKGVVKASMKGRTYAIELSIDPEDGIVEAKCSCPRGQVICHHMAAVCIHAHHNISVTDMACSWNAPKQVKGNEETKSLGQIFPLKNCGFTATARPANSTEIQSFKKNINPSLVGFTWLLQTEPVAVVVNLIPTVEAILYSPEYISAADKVKFFLNKCQITSELVIKIAQTTVGQSANENWLVMKKHRLTASNFGVTLSACRRNRFPPSFYKSLMEGYNLNAVLAIQWGRENEATAISLFEEATGIKVSPTGLWLHECGYLGASPDGLVGDNELIEVKCPYRFRNSSLETALKNDKSYIIFKNDEGITEVNKNHHYWHQIQGQLHITKREKCHLVIWTPNECEIVEILKTEHWEGNILVLQNFYLTNFIPFITSNVL